MRNKPTIRGAVALLLCLCVFCIPLMGMTALADTGAASYDCDYYCDCTVRCTEDAKNPDCAICPNDRSICIGKIMPCVCTVKCTEAAKNKDCYRCGFAIYGCDGKAPEPVPVCDCSVKCKTGAVKGDCAVCKKDLAGCIGKEPTPAPVCVCDVKCTATAKNADCPVCAADIAGCKGKAPTPAPMCGCDVKCTATTKNADCPICAANIAGCKGKAPTPAPVCGCTVKCKAGAVNTACAVCKTDLTGCKGKETTPPPVAVGSYAITIVAPSGWYTKAANVEIRVEDVNGTGWKKVEAKIERGGSWLDLTDNLTDQNRAKVEITENCTVYVTVTGKDGKTTTKSRYIECFDRTAPTIKIGISGKVLRVEASDELSGVEAIYIDGERFTDLTNGTLDVRLRDLGKEYDQFSVQAVDYAGNKSKTVQVKNPNYKAPSNDKDNPTPPPTPTPTPAPTPTPGGNTTKPTGNSGGNSGGASSVKPSETTGPADAKDPNPFTPSGTGTVIDNATGEDGKEFFTIQTPAENVFYLVIDRQRGTENVYFLNAVTEADLAALAEPAEEPVTPAPDPKPEPDPEPTPAPDEQPKPEQKPDGNMGMLLLVAAVVLIGGGAAFYFKVYRPKHQANQPEEDFDEADLEDGEALWDEDGEDGGEEEPTE